MAVMPLVSTQDPSFWAKNEVDQNTALMKMFMDDRRRQEELASRENELAQGRTLSREQLASTQKFQGEQSELARQHQSELYGVRGAGGTGAGGLSPDIAAVQPQWREIEKKYGIPEGSLNMLARLESSGGKNRGRNMAGASDAFGIFQFIPSTMKQYGATPADLQDPIKAAEIAARFTKDNMDYFRANTKKEPGVGDIYGMHVQGAPGFTKLVRNPYGSAVQAVGLNQVVGNYGGVNNTGQQYADTLRAKGIRAHAMWQRSIPPTDATTTAQQPAGTTGAQPTAGATQTVATAGQPQQPSTPQGPSGTGTAPSPTGAVSATAGKVKKTIRTVDPQTGMPMYKEVYE